MNDDDRREIAELAMRALDSIHDEYGDDVKLEAAGLVFEVSTVDAEDGETYYHGSYKSLPRNSPHHIAGLYMTTAQAIMAPVPQGDA